MKVYIGPTSSWIGPDTMCYPLKYIGVSESMRDYISDKIPTGPFEWFDNTFRKRKIKIRIDRFDTYSMGSTLANIIYPMLIQLRNTTHSAPDVDDSDVPIQFRSDSSLPKDNVWDVDSNHFVRWDYVLDEMIFAFDSKLNDEWEEQFYSGYYDMVRSCINPKEQDEKKKLYEIIQGPAHTYKHDKTGYNKYNDRIENGFRLFGKYYSSLWD